MKNTCFGWVVFCALVAILGCRAPSPGCKGTWKLNPSKSIFQEPIFTISVSTDGEYHYYDRAVGVASFTFRCDGKYRSMGNNRTEACVKSSATTLDLLRKENGVETNAYHWELSDGGKILTLTTTRGPVITAQIHASRISGFDGFAGQWQDMGYLKQYADMTLMIDNQTLHIAYPTAGLYLDTTVDGTDAAMRGPHAPEGMTYSARLVGHREIHTVTKRNGKVLIQGSMELSGNGRAITDSWWNPDQPGAKTVLAYEK